jgi:menaquinone-9 beta-reductase
MDSDHTEQLRPSFDAAIIGGGPAGSAAALFLRRSGYTVCLIEKKLFPRETLCGEFISKEVTDGLTGLGLFGAFVKLAPNPITILQLHDARGRSVEADLGFTGYGITRGTFDHFLLSEAQQKGACIIQPAEVSEITRSGERFTVRCLCGSGEREIIASRVIAAYGRQNILDKRLHRNFTGSRSHLNGVKFHLDRSECPGVDARAIHLFTGAQMYCGVNAVNESKVTVCYLEKREAGDENPRRRLQRFAAENASFRNSFTDRFARACDEVPLYGTGNIYFGRKDVVCDGIFMAGDAACVIAPLAGDGMGMAFQNARLLAEVFDAQRARSLDAHSTEALYRRRHRTLFDRRLRIARSIQSILLSPALRTAGVSAVHAVPGLLPAFVSLTRG